MGQGGEMKSNTEEMVPKRITDKIPLKKIKEDLKKYRSLAKEMGAEDAKIISTKEIMIDERVRAKCIYPKCVHYGTSVNCPPHAPDLDFVRKMIGNYHYAIFFSVKGR